MIQVFQTWITAFKQNKWQLMLVVFFLLISVLLFWFWQRTRQAEEQYRQAVVLQQEQLEQAQELCVIGGGEVFALALPVATRMHLTWVDTVVEGTDAFFPRFDPGEWRETWREAHPADARNEFAFAFADFERIAYARG